MKKFTQFLEDTTRTSKKGAPGTLKAKIKGKVTIAKVNALKNKPDATSHDLSLIHI